MRLFDFIKRKLIGRQESIPISEVNEPKPNSVDSNQITVDRNCWTGNDFEFLITGDIDVFDDFDNIMTPNTFEWTKTLKDNWAFYQIGQDEYSYSIEPPGIQMTFNKEITFDKAKKIADEVVENIVATGQNAELVILDNKRIYRFD
jgi:hypothetical protein